MQEWEVVLSILSDDDLIAAGFINDDFWWI